MFDVGSAKFTTGDFECMVRLKKFTLQKTERDTENLNTDLDSEHLKP